MTESHVRVVLAHGLHVVDGSRTHTRLHPLRPLVTTLFALVDIVLEAVREIESSG